MEEVREEKILVTVKTYPTLSRKYGETVCTAGVREDGSWVRLYPVLRQEHHDALSHKYGFAGKTMVRLCAEMDIAHIHGPALGIPGPEADDSWHRDRLQ